MAVVQFVSVLYAILPAKLLGRFVVPAKVQVNFGSKRVII